MKVFVINGFPRSGKSQFVEYCNNELAPWCCEISTVDFVKNIAEKCGWTGEKTPKNRKFLSDLKDLLTDWEDVPYQKVLNKINDFKYLLNQFDLSDNKAVIFIMSREPEEITRFEKELNAESILIRRKSVEFNQQSNHADSEVLNHKYHYIIENNSTLEELKNKAKNFCNYLKNNI